MTIRNVINGIDTIIYRLRDAIADSRSYINAEIEAHNRKFPKDTGSPFVRNLLTKVVSEQDAYMSKLMSNLQYMKQSLKSNPSDLSAVLNNIPNAVVSLQHILDKTERGLGMTPAGLDLRYHNIEIALMDYKELEKAAEREQTSKASVKIPVTYAGWNEIGKNMWQKNQGNYILLVQEYNQKFYSTVKDVVNSKVYSNNTPFNTPMEAMNVSVTTAVKLAHTHTSNEYKPKYVGGQGRLF